MSRQHIIITAALLLLLLIVGLPLMIGGDDDAPEVTELERPVSPDPASSPQRPARQPEQPAPTVPAPEPIVEAPEPPETPAAPPPEPLPDLNDSDGFVVARATEIQGEDAITEFLASNQIVRKFVMLVDNVSRGELPPRDRPLEGPSRPLQAREISEDTWEMQPASYTRFDPLVNALVSMDNEQILELYRYSLPLLEEAYAELGYPDRDFEQALLQAMTRVLNASEHSGPFELTLPSVHYEFADPELETLSAVEKLLIRMGPDNANKLKSKLQELRQGILAAR